MKDNSTSTKTTPRLTRGRGRPAKSDAALQTVPVKVLVTSGQHSKLIQAAAARGVSVSTYIRLKLKL